LKIRKKMADEKKTQEFYLPPPQLSKWEAFRLFLWDSDRKEFMGRNGGSWAKIGLFYLIFYTALAAFFSVMLVIFYQTLDNFEPKWKLDSSLIGDTPGLGFRPLPGDNNVESTLIHFKHGNDGEFGQWTKRLTDFLDPYEDGRQVGHTADTCSESKGPDPGKVCMFKYSSLGENCTSNRQFGFDQGQPCVAIKLNKVFGWVPVPYNGTNMPESVPEEVQRKVREMDPNKKFVWLNCEGESPADKENIGPISYTPVAGFPTYYFPFTNTPGYLSPLVMVQFHKPTPGVLIMVQCTAYAANISPKHVERQGTVHFELLMD
jgi:sodium/potassium-transporting ATPase subunit beta